jgi:hypothetical protein
VRERRPQGRPTLLYGSADRQQKKITSSKVILIVDMFLASTAVFVLLPIAISAEHHAAVQIGE